MTKHLTTFAWVWGVCFLAAWGLMSFIKVAEKHGDPSHWWLGFIALLVTAPIAAAVTTGLGVFRKSIAGTDYEKKLDKVKGLRIGTVSLLIGFAGFAEAVAFDTGIGQVVFFLAWIGMLVGFGVHLHEMFKGVRV